MTGRAEATIGEAQRQLIAAFREAGLETPELDARRLIGHVTGLEAAALVSQSGRRLSPGECYNLEDGRVRRLAHEPISRIIGERWFYGRAFAISPACLDPRPDTETLIDAVATLTGPRGPARILDLGTGSGAILLTLLAEWPDATGVGVDISRAALEVARRNGERLGVGRRATLVEGDGFGPVTGPFDLIVSNPPYIPTGDIAGLERAVRDHDPLRALDGGADGLHLYRCWSGLVFDYISDGWVVFEVGAGQAESVAGLLASAGGGGLRVFDDLGGRPRCVAASPRRPPGDRS